MVVVIIVSYGNDETHCKSWVPLYLLFTCARLDEARARVRKVERVIIFFGVTLTHLSLGSVLMVN